MYGLLLDRMSLSRKNKWYDKQKRVYVIYTIECIQEDFAVSKTVAVRFMKELENFGLIEKKRRPNAAAMIYVKNFILQSDGEEKEIENESLNSGLPEVRNLEVQKMEIRAESKISGSPKSGLPPNGIPEVQKMESNKTKEDNDNNFFSSSSGMEEEDMKRYIKDRVNYYGTVKNGYDRVFVDKVIECLANIFLESKIHENINGNLVPMEQIKKRIAENMNEENFWLILRNMHANGVGTIYNLRKYVMTCFFKLLKVERREYQSKKGGDVFGSYMMTSYDFNELEEKLLSN